VPEKSRSSGEWSVTTQPHGRRSRSRSRGHGQARLCQAGTIACRPRHDRWYPFPDPVEGARASCTPKGRCKIGCIEARRAGDQSPAGLTGGRIRVRRTTRAHHEPGAGPLSSPDPLSR
jgi:hypothetical protein